jgi:predicted ATP-grasp superfamily ATP-dependent carboligase
VGLAGGQAARILVTDAQDRPALAAIRCLHAAGYSVGATANTPLAPGRWSRDCSHTTMVSEPSHDVDEFVSCIDRVARSGSYDLVVPGTDETLYALSLKRDRLEQRVTLGLPAHPVVERALDKSCLAEEAQRAGLPTPESHVCAGVEDGLEAARGFGFPVLMKGVHAVQQADGGLIRHPTLLVADEAALRRAQRRFGPCIIQRRQAGRLMSFSGVVTEQGMLGSVVARYHRTWPPDAGQASFLETVTPPGDLQARVRALVDGIGWRGLFQLQMIKSEDGSIRAIDFNPRLFGSMTTARAGGAPLTALWCAWLLGSDPAPMTARAGVHYRMEDMDARHILWQLRGGDYRGAALAALPQRHTAHAYFEARDPLPLLARGVELAHARWQKRKRHQAEVAGAAQ